MEKELEYTKQGYSYVKCTRQDCLEWGGLGICDSCGELMDEPVYLIFVLGQAFCQKCFDEWKNRTKRYEEDIVLQKQNHIRWYKFHGIKVKGEN